MKYQGSCHCGKIAFEVEGELSQVMECNCSICSRRGALHWFVPRDDFRLLTPADGPGTYTFGKHVIRHRFCPTCGVAPYSEGEVRGRQMVSVNARCLEGVDVGTLKIGQFDGRAL